MTDLNLFLFELNAVGVSGMRVPGKLESLGKDMISIVMPELSYQLPPDPFVGWLSLFGGEPPAIITENKNEVPWVLLPPHLCNDHVFELTHLDPAEVLETHGGKIWWDALPEDLVRFVGNTPEGEWKELAERGLNPLHLTRVENKSLLPLFGMLGLPFVPTTITIPDGCDVVIGRGKKDWIVKPGESFGGNAVRILDAQTSLEGCVLQEKVENREPFVTRTKNGVQSTIMHTDLRVFLILFPDGRCDIAGFLGRVAPFGKVVCNISSGGYLTPGVFLVDDPPQLYMNGI